jgi:uncharacterized protein (TIGR03086 family)
MDQLLDQYDRASRWTKSKIEGVQDDLDAPTACDKWDARTLVNHLVEGAEYFAGSAKGEQVDPPSPEPSETVNGDPAEAYEEARRSILEAYSEDGAVEKTGPLLGIALADTVVHGWDLAKGTGQDTTIPDGLAEAALSVIDGQLTPDRRGEAFKPEVKVGADASPQEKLLAYTGRQP